MSASDLQLEGVTVRFGGLTAVDNLDVTFRADRITGLIGPNGAGKSTVFNAVCGIYAPAAGRMRLGAADITGLPSYAIARCGIARTFQHPRVFKELSVLENLRAGFHIRTTTGLLDALFHTRRAQDELRSFLAEAPANLASVGLEAKANERAANLSYGEQRRLEIARALCLSPRILLLDEPLAGLGEREIALMVECIRRIRQRGIGVVLIEHHMRTVMNLCEHVVVMNFGRKIAEGGPREISGDPVVVEAYLGADDKGEDAALVGG